MHLESECRDNKDVMRSLTHESGKIYKRNLLERKLVGSFYVVIFGLLITGYKITAINECVQ